MVDPILDDFITAINPPKRNRPSRDGRIKVSCWGHDDNNPSTNVWIDDNGKVAFHCHAGCDHRHLETSLPPEAARIARQTWGVNTVELLLPRHKPRQPDPANGAWDARYNYHDEHGGLVFYKLRHDRPDGKRFVQYRPDGTKGRDGYPGILYRLPDVLAAKQARDPIFIVEGEKDADRLAELGLTATTNADGAGKWSPELHGKHLEGADVVVIPDNDNPGVAHADTIVETLAGIAASVRYLILPIGEKGDVSDWLDAGHTAEELLELAQRADPIRPDGEFRISPGSIIFEIDLNPTPLWGEGEEILWAQGEPLLIYGPTGVGKTTIAHRILLALIGIGEPSCLGYEISPLPADKAVLYIAADRPRQAMRSLRRMVDPTLHGHILRERLAIEHYRQLWAGEDDKDMLYRAARQVNAGAIFIDSSKDLAAGPLKDEGPAKGLMDGIQVTIANGIEVVMLHHPRKITQDRAERDLSIDDVYGSAWIAAGVGSVLLVNGDVGTGVVQVSQLKAPATFIQPLEASIDYHTGRVVAATKFGVMEWMRLHCERKKTSEIAQFMNKLEPEDRPTDAQRKAAERLLQDLIVSGELTREKQGNGWVYWVPPEVRMGGI